MSSLAYLERMKLLDEVDEFYQYFFKLHNMAADMEDFDRDEFNKNLAILLKMMQDVKS